MRPNFATIIERIGYCLVDPDVLNAPLPTFARTPSSDKPDATPMRPPPDAEYLVPNNPGSSSNYSMSTEKTELLSPDTCSTMTTEDTKLELDELVAPPIIPPRTTPRSKEIAVTSLTTNITSNSNAARCSTSTDDKSDACERLQSDAASSIPSSSRNSPSGGITNNDQSGEKSKPKSELSNEVTLEPSQLLQMQAEQHTNSNSVAGATRYVNV